MGLLSFDFAQPVSVAYNLLRQIFPHCYRHIANKCTRQDPERRYEDMDAVRKALERNDKWRRTTPWLVVLAVMIPLLGGVELFWHVFKQKLVQLTVLTYRIIFFQITSSRNKISRIFVHCKYNYLV